MAEFQEVGDEVDSYEDTSCLLNWSSMHPPKYTMKGIYHKIHQGHVLPGIV